MCYEFGRSSTSMYTRKNYKKYVKTPWKGNLRQHCLHAIYTFIGTNVHTVFIVGQKSILIFIYITRPDIPYYMQSYVLCFLRSFQRFNCNKWWLILENDKGWERKTFFNVFFSYKNTVLGSWLDRMRKKHEVTLYIYIYKMSTHTFKRSSCVHVYLAWL